MVTQSSNQDFRDNNPNHKSVRQTTSPAKSASSHDHAATICSQSRMSEKRRERVVGSERQRLSRSSVQITGIATPVRVISPGFHENRTEAKRRFLESSTEDRVLPRICATEKSAKNPRTTDRQTDRHTGVEMEERKEGKGRGSVSRGGGCRDSCEPAFTIRNRSMEAAERETTGREKKKREEKGDEGEKRERRAKERWDKGRERW